jgi:hypothetical protein
MYKTIQLAGITYPTSFSAYSKGELSWAVTVQAHILKRFPLVGPMGREGRDPEAIWLCSGLFELFDLCHDPSYSCSSVSGIPVIGINTHKPDTLLAYALLHDNLHAFKHVLPYVQFIIVEILKQQISFDFLHEAYNIK